MGLEVRHYGKHGPWVLVLHGGPGAPGHMAPVARALASSFRVVESMQRRSGGMPLTVARHVADLQDLLEALPDDAPRALVGSSWGAMLALAHAAVHPSSKLPLVLIGCGTFDLASRARMKAIIAERSNGERAEAPAEREALIDRIYTVDPLPETAEEAGDDLPFDAQGHRESWDDMMHLQATGAYPAAFADVEAPVLMLHGEDDPHPGRMIRDHLIPVLPQLEFVEWEACGHYPWRERRVRASFFAMLRAWLEARLLPDKSPAPLPPGVRVAPN